MLPSLSALSGIALVLPVLWTLASCSEPQRRPRRLRAPAPRTIDEIVETEGRGREADAAAARPPSAREAAHRALVLGAIARAREFPRPGEAVAPAIVRQFERDRAGLVDWLKREGAWSAATAREQELLSAEVGTADGAGIVGFSGRPEALAAILWALHSLPEIPEYDVRAPALASIDQHAPAPGTPASTFLRQAQLRPDGEIEAAREKAEIWDWRARAFEVVREKRFPDGRDLDDQAQDLAEKARAAGFRLGPIRNGETFFRELIRFAAHYAAGRGLIPAPAGEDFPALGKSYRDVADRDHRWLQAVARERLHALSWLRGQIADWDAEPEA